MPSAGVNSPMLSHIEERKHRLTAGVAQQVKDAQVGHKSVTACPKLIVGTVDNIEAVGAAFTHSAAQIEVGIGYAILWGNGDGQV